MFHTTITTRQGTESDWSASDIVLASGEIGYAIDSKQAKIGDGVSMWPDLPYMTGLPGPQGPPGLSIIGIDGGSVNSNYGGVTPIDCGGAV